MIEESHHQGDFGTGLPPAVAPQNASRIPSHYKQGELGLKTIPTLDRPCTACRDVQNAMPDDAIYQPRGVLLPLAPRQIEICSESNSLNIVLNRTKCSALGEDGGGANINI